MAELEFFSVIQRLPATTSSSSAMGTGGAEDADETGATDTDYQLVQTQQQLESMLAALHEAGAFAFDTETTSLDPMRANLVGLSFATGPGIAWYVPVGHKEEGQLPLEEVLAPGQTLV